MRSKLLMSPWRNRLDLETKLSPHTTNNAYRKIFEEFYDSSDTSNYKIIIGVSGIMVSGILPNIYFPRMDIANIWEGGLRITNTTLSLELFSKGTLLFVLL